MLNGNASRTGRRERVVARLRPALTATVVLSTLAPWVAACRDETPSDRIRVSGYIEATDVRIAPQIGGRLVEVGPDEGDRVEAGQVVARLDTADIELALQRARAERQQADAQLRLLLAGARPEDIRQAEAQVAAAEAEVAAAQEELTSAQADFERFDDLLRANAGSRKQRDDADTRRAVARQRVRVAEERLRAARETLRRLQAGARQQEVDAARARVAAAEAAIALLDKNLADAIVEAPAAGVITERLAEPGEIVAPGQPILLLVDLDEPWANVYVPEPVVPLIKLGQPATIYTDAGGEGIEGRITFVSPQAEFTPRNVQTAEERSKLVYRIKVSVRNTDGVLKQGMPVEAEMRLPSAATPPPR